MNKLAGIGLLVLGAVAGIVVAFLALLVMAPSIAALLWISLLSLLGGV